MDEAKVLSLFERLALIESPSWHEAEMAQACAAELRALGFQVRFDRSAPATGSDTGNLIATRAGDAPGEVMFSAHMDTVKPCAGIQVSRVQDERGDVLCSVGETILSADDKAGITAIFEGIRAYLESGRPTPGICVLLTTCEEQSLLGSGALCAEDVPQGVDCFVLDADGSPGSVIVAAPCHLTMRARIQGRSAHAGVEPEAGVSAIEVAARAIADMELGRLDEATTANVGTIGGGVATNIVADACTLEGECRSLDRARAEEVRAQMTDAITEACREKGATADVSWVLDYPEMSFSEESPIIQRFRRAAEACGLPFAMIRTGGGADANNLNDKGVHAVTLGVGMASFHTTHEHIKVSDLMDDVRLVEALIAEYASA